MDHLEFLQGIFHPKSFKLPRLETASEVPLAERQMAERSFSGQFGSKLPQKALKPPGTENVSEQLGAGTPSGPCGCFPGPPGTKKAFPERGETHVWEKGVAADNQMLSQVCLPGLRALCGCHEKAHRLCFITTIKTTLAF